MAFAPDGRLFVVAQDGTVRIVKNGTTLPTPFLKITTDDQGERGLTGIAIDPNFATNKYVYLYYASFTPVPHNRVSRFVADGDVALRSGGAVVETPILDLDNLSTVNIHNGGAMNFGADGKLYVAVGENANGSNSQNLNNLLGKVLRINADGTIPTDNPFFATASGKNRAIWALGFRNPFTFTFQPGTNKIFVNDVGGSAWEEINDTVRGGNYGWPTTEGPTTDPRFISPFYAYPHDTAAPVNGCAITGGAFYNPATMRYPSDYVGDYFFADFCNHWIRRIDPVTKTVTDFATTTTPHPVDLKVGPDGNLYYLSRGSGAVVRVTYTGSLAPTIQTQPASQTVGTGESVTFSVVAGGTGPFSYQWQRNGANIAGATGSSYTLSSASAGDNGAGFRVVVTNAAGSVTSSVATLTVKNDAAPTGTISSPLNDVKYVGGQTFTYNGTATDPEDGTLPASAFTWTVDFHHDQHVHPFVPPTTGSRTGQFTIATTGHTETNVWYRIHLTVRDSGGRTQDSYVDLRPTVVPITLRSNTPGLSLNLDDQPRTLPLTTDSVVGVIRKLGAPSPQTVGGVAYQFDTWSDGGSATHDVATPAVATTYTANFKPAATSPVVITRTPIADATANAGAPTTSNGTSASLASQGTNPGQIAYLRFALPAAPAGKTLTGAVLRYRTTTLASAGTDEPHTIRVSGDAWSEATLNWANRPALTGAALGTLPAGAVPNAAYSAGVSPASLQPFLGTSVSMGITSAGTDRLWFWSREHAAASYRPQLVLTFS
ncbi:PQQ-dependent sugar dehydrogenase [Georgenia sp. SYP-B2076]|uniref:PQQ-dependent sugar dehydrogenase n=1 Tax=Georgenia sp. SYP-B2076 TaxID=2495881 RepID=UPI00197AB1DD|nr:PQQ-dependent sugar dehydrogenase [Georgenia sp. SYP-B2076]